MVRYFMNEESLDIPKDIDFTLEGMKITVKGKKGTLTKDFSHMKNIEIKYQDNKLILQSYFPRKSTIALMRTLISIVNNMIDGVTKGYTYKMKIAYSHFPITVEVPKKGREIYIKNFLGERAPRITYKTDDNIQIKANKEDVILTGIDKESIGQTAANIQRICRIRNKDKRIFQDGIWLYEKLLGENEIIWKLKA